MPLVSPPHLFFQALGRIFFLAILRRPLVAKGNLPFQKFFGKGWDLKAPPPNQT